MSKFFKLKEWLTLEEAVQDISKKINETITVANLYRSALDGHLKLSVYFVNRAYGVKGELRKVDDIENHPPQKCFDIKDSTVHDINGIWDLTMQGCEALEIKDYFEQSNSGIKITTPAKNGILLQQGDVTCKLYKFFDRKRIFNPKYNESEERKRAIAEEPMRVLENSPSIVSRSIRKSKLGTEFVPCKKLSEEDCVLIIMGSEVTRFIESLEDTPQEAKPLHGKERTTLLVLLGSILKKANIDINGEGVIGKIRGATELNDTPISRQTISDLLPLIRNAVELKQK